MKVYNLEIFDRSLTLRSHGNVGDIQYEDDYLSPAVNTIIVKDIAVEKSDFIRLTCGSEERFGVVSEVSVKGDGLITISYKSLLTLFDTDVLFDTDLQGGSTSLEQMLATYIGNLFISNTDSVMNITGLSVTTTSSTAGWGFNLKSDTEGKHHCIINLLNVLVIPALQKYGVSIKVVPDVQEKAINLYIGKGSAAAVTIEADLPNVLRKNIIIKESNNDVNKLVVYNTENYTSVRIYYLHPDGTYNTTNSNRIIPVVQEIKGTAPDGTKTFAQMADSEAAGVFGAIEYNNLIELQVMNDDTLINPASIDIGQVVNVLNDGKSYSSMLTGKKVDDSTTLIFGMIRVDLTKILGGRK